MFFIVVRYAIERERAEGRPNEIAALSLSVGQGVSQPPIQVAGRIRVGQQLMPATRAAPIEADSRHCGCGIAPLGLGGEECRCLACGPVDYVASITEGRLFGDSAGKRDPCLALRYGSVSDTVYRRLSAPDSMAGCSMAVNGRLLR